MLLTPNLDYKLKKPLYIQLYSYIADEIQSGRLEAKLKMPSVRKLSTYLGISRNSVENAYNQLLVEGYIESVERRGYFVADIGKTFYIKNTTKEKHGTEAIQERYLYDFKSEYVSRNNFDYKMWKKHLNSVLNYQSDLLYGYGEVRGERVLRERITEYFYRTRGVKASADQIVIGGGVSPLLTILVKLLNHLDIDSVGMEDPGFNKARGIFEYSHLKIKSIPVGENGISIQALKKSHARVSYVSPSYQFPTGLIMPIRNRHQLLEWANQCDGYIIEDDYNAELRFEGKPIPAMQGLDYNDRVIYLGSFSTVLAPAIRVSFMVLPSRLNDLYKTHQALFSQSASKLEQLALAKLIESGDYEKHIRRIRKNYSRKLESVVDYLKRYLPRDVGLRYGKAGLQITLVLPDSIDVHQLVDQCKHKGVLIDSIDTYSHSVDHEMQNQLLINYRGIDESIIEEGVRQVCCVIEKSLQNRKNSYGRKT